MDEYVIPEAWLAGRLDAVARTTVYFRKVVKTVVVFDLETQRHCSVQIYSSRQGYEEGTFAVYAEFKIDGIYDVRYTDHRATRLPGKLTPCVVKRLFYKSIMHLPKPLRREFWNGFYLSVYD